MKEYQKQLDMYHEENTKDKTEAFFEKFWLYDDDLKKNWLSLKENIFHEGFKKFPDFLFKKKYQFLLLGGGILFDESDFKALQSCMLDMKENFFVIIQNYDENDPPRSYVGNNEFIDMLPLRFKFPTNITWDELMDGGFVSTELFDMPHNEYFVFGDSGKWGKYSANDYIHPTDVIGFQPNYKNIFLEKFKDFTDEQDEVKKHLPSYYL